MAVVALITAASSQVYAQNGVGINSTGAAAHPSATLDVSATNKGFLPPRMTGAQRNAIANPANGLVVFCTDCGLLDGELEVYARGMWRNVVDGAAGIAIGDSYGGGKIAYFLQPGDPGYDANVPHGLIAATADQAPAEWGCTFTSVGTSVVIGAGAANTTAIIAGCTTAGIAAKLCDDYNGGGYADWYLPSRDELNKLCINRVAIGGFASNWYWSSSQTWDCCAYSQNFSTSQTEAFYPKGNIFYLRAVRAF